MSNNINFKNGPVVIMEGYGSEPYHLHRNAQELIWMLEGEAGITFNNKEYILNASDDLILLVDADFHKIRQISDRIRYLSFYIDLPYFEKYIKDILHVGLYCNPGYRPPEQIPYLKEMRKLLAQMVWEYKNDEASPQVEDIAVKLLLLIRNHFNFLGTTSIDYQDQDTFERMFKVYDFIYQNYTTRVKLSDLADQIHVSRTYLSRSVKQITGMGFKDILNYVRCEEAVRLLLETDKSITAIAYDCGFSDPKYFNQYFTRFFYANPVEFRKTHKKPLEIDFLINHQHQVTYDSDLAERLNEYWRDLELYGMKPTHLAFLADEAAHPAHVAAGLSASVAPRDFAEYPDLMRLMCETQRDFEGLQLNVTETAPKSSQTLGMNIWPTKLLEVLDSGKVALFSEPGMLNGLYTANGIKTPLYHMLVAAYSAEGVWEFGNNWAVRRSGQGKKSMLLLAWNGSMEKNMEFQIDFEASDKKYFVVRYEFSNATLEALKLISAARLFDGFTKREQMALSDLYRPACSAEIIHMSEYGLPLKMRPKQVVFLTIKEI